LQNPSNARPHCRDAEHLETAEELMGKELTASTFSPLPVKGFYSSGGDGFISRHVIALPNNLESSPVAGVVVIHTAADSPFNNISNTALLLIPKEGMSELNGKGFTDRGATLEELQRTENESLRARISKLKLGLNTRNWRLLDQDVSAANYLREQLGIDWDYVPVSVCFKDIQDREHKHIWWDSEFFEHEFGADAKVYAASPAGRALLSVKALIDDGILEPRLGEELLRGLLQVPDQRLLEKPEDKGRKI
jgi:hypothetical protein